MTTNGTRWRDPDTGLIANPGNIDLAPDGVAGSKLGPYFANDLPQPTATPVTRDRPQAEVMAQLAELRAPAKRGEVPALKALRLLRDEETARKDGGRRTILLQLAQVGVGRDPAKDRALAATA